MAHYYETCNPRAKRRYNLSGSHVECCEPRALLTVTPYVVEVPISATAIAEVPELSAYRSFDLRVRVSRGDALNIAGMDVTLRGEEQFFEHPLGGNAPVRAAWSVFPALEFDTFVCARDFAAPGFLAPGVNGNVAFAPQKLSVDWSPGIGARTGTGEFTIARVTLPSAATATWLSKVVGFESSSLNPHRPTSASVHAMLPLPAEPFGLVGGSLTYTSGDVARGHVFVDLDRDGQFGSNEPVAVTDRSYKLATGGLLPGSTPMGYTFVLPKGEYDVRPVLPAGHRVVPGTPEVWRVIVEPAQAAINRGFELEIDDPSTAMIFGRVNTYNAPLRPVLTAYLDRNLSGTLDEGEMTSEVDYEGWYAFEQAPVGIHSLRFKAPPEWMCTHGNSESFTFSLSSGGVYQRAFTAQPRPLLMRTLAGLERDKTGSFGRYSLLTQDDEQQIRSQDDRGLV